MLRMPVVMLCVALAVAGCGTSSTDRALSGAGIGGASGAALGAVTDLGIVEGALIGGAAGAIAGAVTSPGQVDLGRPVWSRR